MAAELLQKTYTWKQASITCAHLADAACHMQYELAQSMTSAMLSEQQYLQTLLFFLLHLCLESSLQAGCDAAVLKQGAIPHQTAVTKDAVPLSTPTKGWCARRAIPAGKRQTGDSAHPECCCLHRCCHVSCSNLLGEVCM